MKLCKSTNFEELFILREAVGLLVTAGGGLASTYVVTASRRLAVVLC